MAEKNSEQSRSVRELPQTDEGLSINLQLRA